MFQCAIPEGTPSRHGRSQLSRPRNCITPFAKETSTKTATTKSWTPKTAEPYVSRLRDGSINPSMESCHRVDFSDTSIFQNNLVLKTWDKPPSSAHVDPTQFIPNFSKQKCPTYPQPEKKTTTIIPPVIHPPPKKKNNNNKNSSTHQKFLKKNLVLHLFLHFSQFFPWNSNCLAQFFFWFLLRLEDLHCNFQRFTIDLQGEWSVLHGMLKMMTFLLI